MLSGKWSAQRNRPSQWVSQALAHHDLRESKYAETRFQQARKVLRRSQEWALKNGDWVHSTKVLVREAAAKITCTTGPEPK